MEKPLFSNADCLHMYVDDLDKGIEFYGNRLGLKLLWRAGNSCGLGMPGDITEIVLSTDKLPALDMKVESVEEALPRFLAAGGKCVYGPFDIDIGRCAVVSDPWENTYCILDMTKGTYDTDREGNVTGVSKKG
ncbi:MAG: bleomycin resistance protein [Clostridiales bacterium]|nr:bleomycin resistance protein [Clostridiales bacterium]